MTDPGIELLARRPPDAALDWARRTLGERSRLVGIEALTGGMTHANHALRIESPDGTVSDVVLRRRVPLPWREEDPDWTPEQEVATYSLLATSAVPAPRLLAADPRGLEADVPAILLTRATGTHASVPSDVAMDAYVAGLAAALPAIHAVGEGAAGDVVPSYRPYTDATAIRVPDWALQPALWKRAAKVVAGAAPAHRRTFIHRDYHPGNTLWTDGRVTAVLDWTSASFGPPGIDLAHMRANLAMLHDPAIADAFLAAYEAMLRARRSRRSRPLLGPAGRSGLPRRPAGHARGVAGQRDRRAPGGVRRPGPATAWGDYDAAVSDILRLERSGPGGAVARVTLTRPDVHNAFNASLIADLRTTFAALAREAATDLRAVVLAGDGPSFCAGADIAWMRAAMSLDVEGNEQDAMAMADMFETIDTCPVPVIARVHGAALGGGMGLCAVADFVIAEAGTRFGFTETRLGILPAVISPFVIAKIGESHARALFPGGRRFDAVRAQRIGLVHEVVEGEAALDAAVEAPSATSWRRGRRRLGPRRRSSARSGGSATGRRSGIPRG